MKYLPYPKTVAAVACATVSFVTLVTTPIRAQESEGFKLAQQHCAMCHAISHTGNSPHPAAPPFRRLGTSLDLDRLQEDLERGTVLPSHPDMPLFKLDRRTARHIITFIRSLQQ